MKLSRRKKMRFLLVRGLTVVAAAVLLIAATHFPYDVDEPLNSEELEKNRNYYAEAYRECDTTNEQVASNYDTKYLQIASQAAEDKHIEEQVADFVSKFRLSNGAILDVGSGRGYLQDVVENYTGLDISPSVSHFYDKKFVLGSATAMPLPDNAFDGAWSIWVLEHVPNPEQALMEIRRVLKDKAVLFLFPAWNCREWLAEGYNVRPYSDFGLKGKLIKASIPVRDSVMFRAAALIPTRVLRKVTSWFGHTKLHYRLLNPNYNIYWQADSDALNQIDRHEVMLWFESRGDECLNCNGLSGSVFMRAVPSLVIRIHK